MRRQPSPSWGGVGEGGGLLLCSSPPLLLLPSPILPSFAPSLFHPLLFAPICARFAERCINIPLFAKSRLFGLKIGKFGYICNMFISTYFFAPFVAPFALAFVAPSLVSSPPLFYPLFLGAFPIVYILHLLFHFAKWRLQNAIFRKYSSLC